MAEAVVAGIPIGNGVGEGGAGRLAGVEVGWDTIGVGVDVGGTGVSNGTELCAGAEVGVGIAVGATRLGSAVVVSAVAVGDSVEMGRGAGVA